jgi:translation initiation factor 3 subunit B
METAEQANLAVKQLNNHPMDRSHILAINRLTDIEKYSQLKDEYVEPEEEKFVERVRLYRGKK